MNNQITFRTIIDFFLTRIIIGILAVTGCVALLELVAQAVPVKETLEYKFIMLFIGVNEALVAVVAYILLFRWYEKRTIVELSITSFWKNSVGGFLLGLLLQSATIFTVYLAGGYSVTRVNTFSFFLPAFTITLIAGFVTEIILRGIIFRLTEEKFGTIGALLISILLFATIHSTVEGATLLSVIATAAQAGLLFSAVYVFSRSLWFPVFLHFSWDLAEPGIYGGINPGVTIENSLLTGKFTGSELLTGGRFGPGNSIQSLVFCVLAAALFLWLAKRKNNFKPPSGKSKMLQYIP